MVLYPYQRITRGFDDRDLWNFDATILDFIEPRLKVFKETLISYPPNLTEEEWNDILEKILTSFVEYRNMTNGDEYSKEKLSNSKLLLKYFDHLWN